MSKYKKICLTLLGLSVVLAGAINIYWKTVCSDKPCDYYVAVGVLEPLEYAGIVLGIFSLFFLFLPAHYFESWFKKVFPWALPIAFVMTLAGGGGGMMALSKADMVIANGVFWGFVTLIFVLYIRWKGKQKLN